jgi:glycosyltransferase involved in cell wall biosynthesis
MDGLRERGHAVHFLGSCPVLLERSANIGIPHQQLIIGDPPVTKSGVVSFLWREQSMHISLERAMDHLQKANGSFDVVCMLSLTEKLLLTPWCLAHGIRVVWIEHDPVGRWLQWNPWLSILRRLSEKVMTVCVSKMMKEQYYDLGFNEEHLRVIPNGVPPPERVISSLEPLKNMRIGCMARLAPEKGIDTLLFALEGLEGVSLSIIGTGKEEGFLRRASDLECAL